MFLIYVIISPYIVKNFSQLQLLHVLKSLYSCEEKKSGHVFLKIIMFCLEQFIYYWTGVCILGVELGREL